MGVVPRSGVCTATLAVMMTERGTAVGAAASPISTGRFHRITRECCAVHLRAGQHIVTVRIVAPAVDHFALFGKRCLFAKLVVVTVQTVYVFRDPHALGVVPRTFANAVSCIDGRLTAGRRGTELGVPGTAACPHSGGQVLAVLVGAG